MAIFNGTDLVLTVSPSSGGANAKLMHSQTVSLSINVDELFTQAMARTAVTFVFGLSSPASGDYTYSGSGFITSMEYSAGTEDAPTYSVSIEGSGALTQNTI